MLNSARYSKRWWLSIAIGLAALCLAHGAALVFRIQPSVSLWFPPAGVAVALTLWIGFSGVLLTGIASSLMAPAWGLHGNLQLLGFADAIEPLVAWWVYRQLWNGSLTLNSLRDAIAFTLSAPLLASATSATVGTLLHSAIGLIPSEQIAQTIPYWWLGNALGVMAIAPVALVLLTPVPQVQTRDRLMSAWQRRLEVTVILALSVLTAALSVLQTDSTTFNFQQLSFLGFIPILWAAARFGVAGGVLTASYCVIATLVAYVLAYAHLLSTGNFPVEIEVLQVHKLSLLVQCGVGLWVGTAISERAATQAALAVEQVRSSEYAARAQLSEQLIKLNESLTQANLSLAQSNLEKDQLMARQQIDRQRLEASEIRLRTSLETMLDSVSILSAVRDELGKITDFRFDFLNAAACEIYQITPADRGESWGDRFSISGYDDLLQAYVDVVETGEPLIREALVFGDRVYDIRAAKLEDGLIASWRDVTARQQIEIAKAELLAREQEARTAAETASRLKDEFLAIVSHELRSPLNAMMGWSQLLRARKLPPAKVEQALEAIERNAKAQAQLIEDLLDISRIVRGQIRLERQPTVLESVVNAAIDTVRPTAETKGVTLDWQDQTDGLIVSGDAARLQQVAWNLLTNAIKFTPKGGRITVRLEEIGKREAGIGSGQSASRSALDVPLSTPLAQLTITDTGIGISADFLPYVFERFRQADSSTTRAQGGLGLGLAIVRNLVELHGGSIAVSSPGVGLGATFTARLPLMQEKSEPVKREFDLPSTSHASRSTPLHILLIDDESDNLDFLKTALEQRNLTVTALTSAADALKLLPQLLPDVLISDISMPDRDGYWLIQQVRSLPAQQGGKIPAIALTAYAREEDRARAIAAGFQVHIAKPVDPIELTLTITKLTHS